MAENPYEAWRESVGAVLAKSLGGTPPEDPIAALTTPTEDEAVLIAPLYSARDELPEPPLPGVYPYTRGGSPTPDVRLGWRVAEPFGPEADSADVLGALESGASALWITRPDPAPLLAGVYPDMAPILVTAGAQVAAAAEQVLAALDTAAHSERYRPDLVRVSLGAAPLTSAVVGRADVAADEAIALAQVANVRSEDVRALVVDGADLHNAGASCAQELGLAAAAGLEHIRALTAAGLSVSAALGQLTFRLAATDDQFLTLAKIRAWRTVWARVAGQLGHPGAGNAPVHAVTSLAATSQRDPWVNILRGTIASFGAGVGGADYVSTLGYDAALPGGIEGYSAGFSRRIARNTQLLLLEESNLGRVADPGAGSWHVESLTADLALAAWTQLQATERSGGFSRGIEDESIAAHIAESAARRDAAVSRRARKLTGVNEFPNLAEAPIEPSAATNGPVVRAYAAPFEALRARSDSFLRDRGARPRIQMVTIGSVAEHNGRSTFLTNLLASGGIETVTTPQEQAEGAATVDGSPGAKLVVLAGSNAGYKDQGEQLARSLREQGYLVLLAGLPGTIDDGLIDIYLHAKIDAAAALDDLLTRLGA